jgi:putative peptidoglycan lipid II flippase
MVISVGLLVVISALVGILPHYFLPFLGSGFSPAKLLLTRQLLYALLPYIALSGLAVTWTGMLNAEERFALPALSLILTPLSAIAFLLLLGRSWGIFALAAGTVAGVALQAAVLGGMLSRRGVRLEPRWHGLDPSLRRVIGQYAPMLACGLLMGSGDLVNQTMAAMLEPGSVAALNYARKVVSVFIVVGATPLGTAALPYFSQMVAERDWSGCRRTLKTYVRSVALITVPLTLGLMVFSHPLIRIIFQRGAFAAEDTRVVSHVLVFLSPEIPFFILVMLGIRLISALKRNSVLAVIAGVNMALNVILNLILMRYIGVAGIALSTSCVYLVSWVLVYVGISRSLGRLASFEAAHGKCSA